MKIGHYNIQEIENTIREMKKIKLIGDTSQYTVVTLDSKIIDLLGHLQFPTIHDTLEAILYYLTWTDRTIEFDYYLQRFLSDNDYVDSTILDIISTVELYHILDLVVEFLIDVRVGNERYFNGWTTNKKSYNFSQSFDFILIDELPLITTSYARKVDTVR